MPTLRHRRLSFQLSLIYRVCFGSKLLIRVLFKKKKFGCIIFILIVTSCVKGLSLKVESLERPLHMSSPLEIRVRIDQIRQECELEILRILPTVDQRIMDISDLDAILNMDG